MPDIPESDWKHSRNLHATALDRLCTKIVQATLAAAQDANQSNHDRFRAIFRIIHEGNEEIARIFDGARRSVCLQQLAAMRAVDLLTDAELETLTPISREWIIKMSEFIKSR